MSVKGKKKWPTLGGGRGGGTKDDGGKKRQWVGRG